MNNPFDPGYLCEAELRAAGFRSVGRHVQIAKTCTIIGLENIDLGDNVRIDGYCTIVAAGQGFVKIGSFVHIAGYCGLYAGHGITLSDFAGLSAGVRIYSATDDYSGRTLTNPTVPEKYKDVRSGPVAIGRHVIIGSGSVLLPGLTANEGASVGALSVIRRDLEPWSVYAGNPARRLGERVTDLLALEAALLAEQPRPLAG
jgi:galactoside O-acetyltransferase